MRNYRKNKIALLTTSSPLALCPQNESTTAGAKVSSAAARGATDGVSKWEQSRKKGEMGYYFAHHTSHKELAPEEYRMNGPRLLSKGEASPAV